MRIASISTTRGEDFVDEQDFISQKCGQLRDKEMANSKEKMVTYQYIPNIDILGNESNGWFIINVFAEDVKYIQLIFYMKIELKLDTF